jgi:hypothetical protein
VTDAVSLAVIRILTSFKGCHPMRTLVLAIAVPLLTFWLLLFLGIVFSSAELTIALLLLFWFLFLPAYVLYWIIRLAVRHGSRDADQNSLARRR